MYQEPKIAPSILSADFMNLESQIKLIEDAGAGYIHVDVMDGHFVPNLTIGVPVVAQLAKIARIPLDVHLMIDNPLEQLSWYLKAGANMVTMHVEAFSSEEDMKRAVDLVHKAGAHAALAIKPKTPASALQGVIGCLDMVLVMSVEPGFSGQSYIQGSEEKVAAVVQMARAANVAPLIEVDGGIGLETVGKVALAGADVFVCGSAVYAAKDPVQAVKRIEAAARDELSAHKELRSFDGAGQSAGQTKQQVGDKAKGQNA